MSGRPIGEMRGIGPKSAIWLREAGITTEEELRMLGPVAAYLRLKHRDPRGISLNMLWGLYAAIEGMPWTAVDRETKERLLGEADALSTITTDTTLSVGGS